MIQIANALAEAFQDGQAARAVAQAAALDAAKLPAFGPGTVPEDHWAGVIERLTQGADGAGHGVFRLLVAAVARAPSAGALREALADHFRNADMPPRGGPRVGLRRAGARARVAGSTEKTRRDASIRARTVRAAGREVRALSDTPADPEFSKAIVGLIWRDPEALGGPAWAQSLTPGNVLVDRSEGTPWRAVLTHFDASPDAPDPWMTSAPGYFLPDHRVSRARGLPDPPRAHYDLWALGMLLHFVVCGRSGLGSAGALRPADRGPRGRTSSGPRGAERAPRWAARCRTRRPPGGPRRRSRRADADPPGGRSSGRSRRTERFRRSRRIGRTGRSERSCGPPRRARRARRGPANSGHRPLVDRVAELRRPRRPPGRPHRRPPARGRSLPVGRGRHLPRRPDRLGPQRPRHVAVVRAAHPPRPHSPPGRRLLRRQPLAGAGQGGQGPGLARGG